VTHLAPAGMGTTRLERQPHPLKSYVNFYRRVICGMGLQHGEGQVLCPRESRMQGKEFQNHVNFEHCVVLILQLWSVKPYGSEYSSLLWCYYLWVGRLLSKGYKECLSVDIKAISSFETSANMTVDMAAYLWILEYAATQLWESQIWCFTKLLRKKFEYKMNEITAEIPWRDISRFALFI
jgi:hypothetical protein